MERERLATLKLNHDALGLAMLRKENLRRDELVAWLYGMGQQFAWLGQFCATVALELQKGEHGDSSVLVCYAREYPKL